MKFSFSTIMLLLFTFLSCKAPVSLQTTQDDPWFTDNTAPKKWTNLLDKKFKYWDKFVAVPHVSVEGLDGYEKFEDVHNGKVLGVNNDVKNVFTMIEENGEPVLKVSGEIYGGLTSKKSYGNYHLTLQYRWGNKKWAPRLADKKDSGVLYHCQGNHGSFWSSWMRCLECQIQEGDTGDFIPLAGPSVQMPLRTPAIKKNGLFFDKNGEMMGVGKGYDFGYINKSETHENPHGEWTTVEVYVLGDQAIHVVNGHLVNYISEARLNLKGDLKVLDRGKIQIQSEAAEIFYKQVKIKAISDFPAAFKAELGLE